MAPFKKIFSLPVNSSWNPTPKLNNPNTLPFSETFPSVGVNTPAMIFKSVVFPAPFLPIIPNTWPLEILKDTFFSAQKSSKLEFALFAKWYFLPAPFNSTAFICKLALAFGSGTQPSGCARNETLKG